MSAAALRLVMLRHCLRLVATRLIALRLVALRHGVCQRWLLPADLRQLMRLSVLRLVASMRLIIIAADNCRFDSYER
jgi:hypothetical protein